MEKEKNYLFELVLMNDEPCYHEGEFFEDQKAMCIPQPKGLWREREDGSMYASVFCSVCGHKYEEASKRVLKDGVEFLQAHPNQQAYKRKKSLKRL